MDSKEEEHILENIRNGNGAGFALLVNKYKSMAFSIAYRITENREDAEEVAQDAFVKSFKAIPSFKGGAKFSTWLYRIVYTTAISKTRNFKRIFSDLPGMEDDATHPSVEDIVTGIDDEDRKKYLQQAIESLKAEESIIVFLYYYDEKSLEEIGEITGNTPGNVKIKLFRSRKKMQEYLIKNLKSEARQIL